MRSFHRSTVTDRTDTAPAHQAREDEIIVERRWPLDASDVVALVAGLFYGVVGLVALIRLGVGDFPSEATTQVVDLTHTQLWAGASILLGLLLLGGAGGVGRSLTTFAGALLVVVGIVVVAAREQLDPIMATNAAYGWVAIVMGAVVLLAAIAVPTVSSRRDQVIDLDRHPT